MKTKRLTIKPLDENALNALRLSQKDDGLIEAYGEMLEGVKKYPSRRLWYTAWQLSLPNGTPVGDFDFKGPPDKYGKVEIGYGVLEEHQGNGYATEALEAMCSWGFSMPKCYFIQAQTEDGNRASERVLEKCGFIKIGRGNEGNLWERERPASSALSAFMCLGMASGMAFGLINKKVILGMCIGLAVGVTVGLIWELIDRKMRIKGREQTKEIKRLAQKDNFEKNKNSRSANKNKKKK